jgi:hypothetical protein
MQPSQDRNGDNGARSLDGSVQQREALAKKFVEIITSGPSVRRGTGHAPPYAAIPGLDARTSRAGMNARGENSYSAASPAECNGIHKERIEGNPDPKYISTSYAERNNLNVRMHSRRLTRLTNAFSKKVENHGHAMALHFMYYNFVRIHKTLRTTPAMAANVTKRLWEIGDIVDVLEAWEAAHG